MGHLGVVSNATFAVNRDSDRESHQFLCFSIERFGCRCRSQKRAKGLPRIWRAVPQQPDPGYDIVRDLRIVLAHIVLPSIDDLRSKRESEWSDLITLSGIMAGRQSDVRFVPEAEVCNLKG